jgi:ParB-like chromosome segregation protein Spo0J
MPENDLKPGEFTYRDPKTLQPHPASAALYLAGREGWGVRDKLMTPLEAANEIMEQMDVSDIIDSIANNLRDRLVINPQDIIISGCRRWKCAMLLGLTSIPVEVKSFANEIEEKRAILDYNRYREKTFSQKMKEAELMAEIAGISAKKKMITGKKDPTPILGEGTDPKRHARETKALVGSRIGMGTETFRKAEQIWNKYKEGNPVAIELVGKLDGNKTSVNAAFTTLKKADDNRDLQQLSKYQLAEPIGEGSSCICQTCGKSYQLVHCQSGKHRLVETSESNTPILRLRKAD